MAGLPFFLEPLPFTVASASAGPANRPASHLAEFKYAGMVWQSNAASEHIVTIDFGAAVTFDHVCLLNTNAQADTRMWIGCGTSAAQASGGSPAFSTAPALLIDPAQTGRSFWHGYRTFAPQTFRYLALRTDSHSGVFEASILAVGRRISPASYYESEWEAGPEDLGNFALSRNGVADQASGSVLRRLGFTLARLTEAEHDLTIQPLLQRLGRSGSVLCCFDPEETVYRQGRTYFGTMADQGRALKRGFNRFEKRFEIISII